MKIDTNKTHLMWFCGTGESVKLSSKKNSRKLNEFKRVLLDEIENPDENITKRILNDLLWVI